MLDYHGISPKLFAQRLLGQFTPEEIERTAESASYANYQDDPVGFSEDVLGETLTDDVKAMMESVRDNEITIAKSANATGKTHGAARVAVWFYKVFNDAQVWTAAAPPEDNLRKLLWGEIGSVYDRHPKLFAQDVGSSLHIARNKISFITGVRIPSSGTEKVREAKFSGKHAPHLLFVLDEGDAIPDEVYRGIESCMSGGHVRLLIMYNPRAEAGEPYRMERDGRAHVVHLSAFNHPNVTTGRDVIPGAVTRDTTVRRVHMWCRPVAEGEPDSIDCYELPTFLVGATAPKQSGGSFPPLKPGKYKIMEPAFSYMVLGEFPAQGTNQLISGEWIARARARWDVYVTERGEIPPTGITPIMGLDVAEMGDDSNILAKRYGGWVPKLEWWSDVDVIVTADRAADRAEAYDAHVVYVDATGVGAGVAPFMRKRGVNAVPVKSSLKPTLESEFGVFGNIRDQLWWSCREWLRVDPGAMLPPDEYLEEELKTPTYEVVNGKIKVMQKKDMRELLKRSPDRADGLCLTFAPEETVYDPLDLEECFK